MESVDVTIVNLEEYVAGVCRVMIGETLSNVVPSVSEGLSGVIDISYLASFSPKELDIIISVQSVFTKTDLDNNLLYDHGYSSTSNAVILLREILADFSPEEQEKFLIFVTGSRLPYEGLAGLSPRLTVVRKAPMELQCQSWEWKSRRYHLLPHVQIILNYLIINQKML